ncbi:hypothetical protein N7532_003938 [Penicillium argentinense]|uniref:Uncharacterized protein n=1 Tax=Penicillium argentinense TaxID=1131581 RepID=A0A9W9KEF8_9EURO|nr:uncharacterized protein N7532_003938 [Penicillium argentinense]KAJ5103409.1 hypothetical protein N7532_003938 [Penicillium argentinense]
MTTVPNVYSAEPAFPILAHSLLTQSGESRITDGPFHDHADGSDWNLANEWNIGIRSTKSAVLQYGTVIGFSRLRTRSKDNDEYIGQIPRYLLTKHLLNNSPSPEPSAFIIFPSGFEAFAPRTLLNCLQSAPTQPKLSREEAIKRLDSVQLLPVHDFPNAAQAISKVSESLQQIDTQRQQSNTAQPIVFIVVGLDSLIEGVIRASNPVRGTALLAATLRNLTRMSRTHASYLSIMLVNTSGLGPASFETNQQGPNQSNPREEDTTSLQDDGIHSIFQTPDTSLLNTLLMKTLDQGMDTHILLSDVKMSPIAEVVKSRTGPGLGKWGVWSPIP